MDPDQPKAGPGSHHSKLWRLTIKLILEPRRLPVEPWRVFRPVVADTNHSDEESDTVPHQRERSGPDLHKSEKQIRIRIEVRYRMTCLSFADLCTTKFPGFCILLIRRFLT
jgi:hypothetical protein